jgi:hypothetical protein
VANAVLAREDALHNSDDGMMFVWVLRCDNSILVDGDDIGEYVAGILFANGLRIRQGEKERLAYAKRSQAIGIGKAYMFGHWYSFRPTL